MSSLRRTGRCALLALLLVAGCRHAGQEPSPPALAPPQGPAQPTPQFHDFGMIAHGKAAEFDFVLDTRRELGPDFYTLGTHIDCSCARVVTLVRDASGIDRAIDVYRPDARPQAGELLVIRLQVDTARKEPADLGPIDSHAMVQFQPTEARDGHSRVQWLLTFRYGIDSPVRLRPYAVLDFERVPVSAHRQVLTSIASDLPDRPIHFGPVHCDDPRLQLTLEPKGELTFLRAVLTPRGDDEGNLRTLVTIDTDLDTGYRVELAAIAQIIPDLVALPIAKVSIRADLRRQQTVERAQSQYLLVTDHDQRRPAEFQVARLVDAAGNDASKDFEVTFEPVAADDRSRRMRLRWIGHAEAEFRGQIVLAKDPVNGPFLPIEVVALHAPEP